MAKHLYTFINPTSTKHLEEVNRLLEDDGLVAYPTDVNWAIGCSAMSSKGLDKIRAMKPSHPKTQPFSLLCNSISMVASFADVDNFAYSIMKRVLPGPYTFILRTSKQLSRIFKDNRPVVGVRVPNSELLIDLIQKHGNPLATSSLPPISLERKGAKESKSLAFGYELEEFYGHALEMILDLGEEVSYKETTIIDLSEDKFLLVREGEGSVEPFKELL